MKISRILTPFLLAACLTTIHGMSSSAATSAVTSSQTNVQGADASVTKKKGIVSWRAVGRESVKLVVIALLTAWAVFYAVTGDLNNPSDMAWFGTIGAIPIMYIYKGIGYGVNRLFIRFGSRSEPDNVQKQPKGFGVGLMRLITWIAVSLPVTALVGYFWNRMEFALVSGAAALLIPICYEAVCYGVDLVGCGLSHLFPDLKEKPAGIKARQQAKGAAKLLLHTFVTALIATGWIFAIPKFMNGDTDWSLLKVGSTQLTTGFSIALACYLYEFLLACINALFAPSNKEKLEKSNLAATS